MTRRSTRLALEACACLLSMIGIWLLSSVSPGPQCAVAATAVFAWSLTIWLRIAPGPTLLISPVLISKFAAPVSLILIAYGFEIPELGLVGRADDAMPAWVFVETVFLASIAATYVVLNGARRPRATHRPPASTLLFHATIGMVALAIAIMMLNGGARGFPLLEHTDRFAYRRTSAWAPVVYILAFKSTISLALGMAAFRLSKRRSYRWTATATFLLFVGTCCLFGDKFFTILVTFDMFLMPYIYLHLSEGAKLARRLAAIAIAPALLVSALTLYTYSDGGRQTAAYTIDKVFGRLVGQGELWFLQNRIGSDLLRWDRDFVARNAGAFNVKNTELYALRESIGPAYFSNRYTPVRLRHSLARNGGTVTLTGALEPLGLAAFGWIGLMVMMALCGVISAAIISYLGFAIRSGSMISAILAGYLMVQLKAFLQQGAPWVLFSASALKWIAVIVAIETLSRLVHTSRRSAEAAVRRSSK